MFKGSSFFKFTNFSLKKKYNNTVVYSVNGSYLFSRGRQEKKFLKQFLIKSTIYLLIFRQNSMIFKGSLNSLKESYFIGELRLAES